MASRNESCRTRDRRGRLVARAVDRDRPRNRRRAEYHPFLKCLQDHPPRRPPAPGFEAAPKALRIRQLWEDRAQPVRNGHGWLFLHNCTRSEFRRIAVRPLTGVRARKQPKKASNRDSRPTKGGCAIPPCRSSPQPRQSWMPGDERIQYRYRSIRRSTKILVKFCTTMLGTRDCTIIRHRQGGALCFSFAGAVLLRQLAVSEAVLATRRRVSGTSR